MSGKKLNLNFYSNGENWGFMQVTSTQRKKPLMQAGPTDWLLIWLNATQVIGDPYFVGGFP